MKITNSTEFSILLMNCIGKLKKIVVFALLIILLVLTAATPNNATVNVVIKAPGYIVFASDGRAVDSNGIVVTETYEKITPVTKYVMAQALQRAVFGSKDFGTMINDFRYMYGINDSSRVFIDSTISLFRAFCKIRKASGVDFSDSKISFAGADLRGELQYIHYIPSTDSLDRVSNYNIYFYGTMAVISRLLNGIDGSIYSALRDTLFSVLPDSQRNPLITQFDSIISDNNIVLDIARWSRQDAIDFAYTLVYSTIMIDRMVLGNYSRYIKRRFPCTGGRILVCVATQDGIQWILQPTYSPPTPDLPLDE